MPSRSPNHDHLERFTSDIEERYDYSKLKDWPLEELQGEEFLLRNEFERFKITFPSQESLWHGELRKIASGDSNEEKYPLTTAERLRLEDARKSAESEIYRAIGARKDRKREQRSELMNALVDITENIKYTSLSLFASIKQLKPW